MYNLSVDYRDFPGRQRFRTRQRFWRGIVVDENARRGNKCVCAEPPLTAHGILARKFIIPTTRLQLSGTQRQRELTLSSYFTQRANYNVSLLILWYIVFVTLRACVCMWVWCVWVYAYIMIVLAPVVVLVSRPETDVTTPTKNNF